MTDNVLTDNKGLTPESFKDVVLELERDNLRKLDKDDKKVMVARIKRLYEEAKKRGN